MPRKQEPPKEVSAELSLDPCPWCDGEMQIMMNAWRSACWIIHRASVECVFGESNPYDTPQEAAEAWNNRVKD